MKNNRGSLTIDFAFAMVLVGGVSAVVMALCFTLAVVEIGQYVAFSTSRTYFGADMTPEVQLEKSNNKFNQLVGKPGISNLLRGSWFTLKNLGARDYRGEYASGGVDNDNDTFFGVELAFTAKLLDMRIPFYGSTAGDNGFNAKINSFLGREPTFQECSDFVHARWENIVKTQVTGANIPDAHDLNAYVPIMDNGC